MVKSISRLFHKQGSEEQRVSKLRQPWNVIELVRVVTGETISKTLIEIGVSKYAVNLLYEEICGAQRMTFHPNEGSEESSFTGNAIYTYGLSKNSSKSTHVRLQVVPEVNCNVIFQMKCECKFTFRVGLPCRRALLLALFIDKAGKFMLKHDSSELRSKSSLEILLRK